MDLRISISNSIVKEILSNVAKQDKRIFIQEAILHFVDEISRGNTRSVVYDPHAVEDQKQTDTTEKVDEIKEYTEITEENIQEDTEITGVFDEFSFSLD